MFSSHIIAILAAILFPVFARAREKARANNCLSNVKQIALGLLMYANDYDERFMTVPWSAWPGWRTMVYPYVKNAQIFQCMTCMPVQNTPELIPGSTTEYFKRSYEPNSVGGGSTGGKAPLSGRYMAEIIKPAETILTAESWGDGFGIYWDQAANLEWYRLISWHSMQANYSFADGHAKSLKPTMTCTSTQNYWTIQDDVCNTASGLFQALAAHENNTSATCQANPCSK